MIQVINRALNILEVLAQDPNKEFGLSEIAATTDLNAGTCANILKTLVLRNYVEQPNVKKGYKLGYMIYHLTRDNFYNTELINISKVAMENLRDSINETVILSIIKGNKRILLHESQCTHEIQVRTTNESSVYRATTGRMILSFYSPKELNDFIEKVGLPTEDEWPEVVVLEEMGLQVLQQRVGELPQEISVQPVCVVLVLLLRTLYEDGNVLRLLPYRRGEPQPGIFPALRRGECDIGYDAEDVVLICAV